MIRSIVHISDMTYSDFSQISMNPKQYSSNLTLYENQMTLGQLAENYPSIAWKEWLTALFPSTIIITENEPIVVPVPSYIAKLENLLATTPKRVVANYMFWGAVYETYYVRDKLVQTTISTRWRKCVNDVNYKLGLSIASLFAKKHLSKKAKTTVNEMFDNIKAEFIKMFRAVN